MMKQNSYMGFSGFKFTDEALKLAPDFCRETNGSIYFKANGCVDWLGRKRKVWLDNGVYVERPVLYKRGTPQGLLHLLHAFTVAKFRPNWKKTKIYMKCKNPMCVNPDHMGFVDRRLSLSEIYPEWVLTGAPVYKPIYRYFAIRADFTEAKEFKNAMDLSDWLGYPYKMVKAYLITGRKLKGKWIIAREKVETNYRDLELEPLHEFEEDTHE